MLFFAEHENIGDCVASPVDVFLNDNNAYQPDIIFLLSENLSIIKKDGKVHGTPDLIVEVLSSKNEDHDKVKKRSVYEACGVKEYFIVEPGSKEVTPLYLGNKKYNEGPKVKGKIVSKLLKKTFKF